MNLMSTEEVNPLESGENANERQDEKSFALAEIKQGTRYIHNHKSAYGLI